jgi:hypothetical protein
MNFQPTRINRKRNDHLVVSLDDAGASEDSFGIKLGPILSRYREMSVHRGMPTRPFCIMEF